MVTAMVAALRRGGRVLAARAALMIGAGLCLARRRGFTRFRGWRGGGGGFTARTAATI
ncbi:MAG: hypothetical protein JWM33_475, partial [Caulobacteraceae bacterium]|nr:hypothetical protein [Caulobacteraceae bacterium]